MSGSQHDSDILVTTPVPPVRQWPTAGLGLRFLLAVILISGAIAIGTFVFLDGMDAVIRLRSEHASLCLLAPAVGLLSGWVFTRPARSSAHGNVLVVGLLRRGAGAVPRLLAPIIVIGTWASHLVGMSVGREGTAVQMGAGLAAWIARLVGISPEHRRLFVLLGVAGGFGAVFGVPIAGAVFAIEVSRRRVKRRARGGWRNAVGTAPLSRGSLAEFALCLIVAFASDLGARALGAGHVLHGHIGVVDLGSWENWLSLALTALACGSLAWAFLFLLHHFKILWAKLVCAEAWRPAAGGAIFGGALFLSGPGLERYASLGVGAIQRSLVAAAAPIDPVAKLLATAFSIGVGFKGGEVTPLFFMGATAGSAISGLLGIAPVASAGIGLVACFAAAADVPIAAATMAGELFGLTAFAIALPSCFFANWVCRHSRLYDEKPEL